MALDTAALIGLVLLALALRWPDLMLVPRFTDELLEVQPGIQIARGQAFPLVNWQPHIGAMFNYLVAAAFLLVGPRIEVGRLVVMLLGALTVVPAYLLGRGVGGRGIGVLTGLLVAVSATHIAVNSHIAYSHSLTPLFSTTGLWLLHRAVVGRSGWRLAVAGLAFGLALQSHPSALALWPGLAVYLVWKGRPLVGRWLAAAAGLATLAVANLVIYNITTGLSGVVKTANRTEKYVGGNPFALQDWPPRLLELLRELPAGLAGVLSESVRPDAWLHPLALLYGVLALVGLVLLGRRGEWLPILALLSGLLVISLLNGRLEQVVPRERHYALLLPLLYLAVATAVFALPSQLARLFPRPLPSAAAIALIAVLSIGPPLLLREYYVDAHRGGRTNRALLEAIEAALVGGQASEPVSLDSALYEQRTFSGGRLLDQLRVALEIRGQRFEVVDIARERVQMGDRPGVNRRVLLHPDNLGRAAARYRAEPLPGDPGPAAPLRVFRVYRDRD